MFTSPDAYAVPADKDQKEKKEKREKKYKPRKSLREQGVAGVKAELISPVSGEDFTPVCPATTPEWLIDIFNVHKDNAENFAIYLMQAPTEDYVYELTSNHPALTLNGKTTIAVKVPEGAQETEPFSVKATELGEYSITAQRIDGPPTPNTYAPFDIPVNVWEFDGIVDYGDLGGNFPCYDGADPPGLVSLEDKRLCGKEPDAIASDGTSRLLLRLDSAMAGSACFKVVDDGTGVDPGRTEPEDSTDIATADDVFDPFGAFGTYVAPEAFGDQLVPEREVTVEIAFTPQDGVLTSNTLATRKTIKVRRPPLVLVHGVWSKAATWSGNPMWEFSKDNLRKVYPIEYKSVNDENFDVIIPVIGEQLQAYISRYRADEKAAVAKADVVAHSLGGILIRRMISGQGYPAGSEGYKREDNYFKGDIHRFVALAAPLQGTQFGNLWVNLNKWLPDSGLAELMEEHGYSTREGAICDVAENSPLLSYPPENDTQGLAYTATGGDVPGVAPYFDFGAWWFLPLDQIAEYIEPYYFQEANDGIVGETSQIGGLTVGQNFPIHSHTGVRGDGAVAAQLFADLDASPGNFGPLPGYTSDGTGVPRDSRVGNTTDRDAEHLQYVEMCSPSGLMNP